MTLGKRFKFHGICYISERKCLSERWATPSESLVFIGVSSGPRVVRNRELNQQRRRRLRKGHLKNESTLLQTLSRLFHLLKFVKCWRLFLELNSKGL